MTPDRTELFKDLSTEQHFQVIALARRVHVPSGSTLFNLGETADSLFLVERGRMALTLPMQVDTRENDVLIEERLPGQALGWSALTPPHRFTLKAAALIDSDVLELPRTSLLEHFAAHPDVGYLVTRNIAEVMGQRLQVFQAMWLREMQRVIDLHTGSARATA
jgi:toluene monooxygenase system ferredoxin subunit